MNIFEYVPAFLLTILHENLKFLCKNFYGMLDVSSIFYRGHLILLDNYLLVRAILSALTKKLKHTCLMAST